MFRNILGGLALAISASVVSQSASAAVVPLRATGETTVEVTADLAGLGLSGAPYLDATVDASGPNPVFAFPITGGTLDPGTGAAMTEHDNSGVTLSAGSTSATVGNFVVDTAGATVDGDIIGGATDITFFTFGTPTGSGIPLLISDPLATTLTGVFGAPDLEGAEFGIANTSPTPVPLPAGLPLLAMALGSLVLVRRKPSN